MSEYVKVYMDMDEGWVFYPVEKDPNLAFQSEPTMTISREFLDEYWKAAQRFEELNSQMEQLWRIQTNRSVYENTPIPEHNLLKEKKDGA